MPHQTVLTSRTMKAPSLVGRKHKAQTSLEMTLVQKAESEALSYFKSQRNNENPDPHLEGKFLIAIKESPSAYTVDLGILFAEDAGWCKALDELLTIDTSTYAPVDHDHPNLHPLEKPSFTLLELPVTSPSKNRRFIDTALLHAVITKKVHVVEVFAKHTNFDIEDICGKPLLHYAYLLDDKKAKKQIIDIAIPKSWPSPDNLREASEHGDLEGTKYITERLHPNHRHFITIAGPGAILNGHDDVAKWFTEIPEIIKWKEIASYFVSAAVERNNLELIEFFAKHANALSIDQFGYGAASELWAFLKKVHHLKLFNKFLLPYIQPFEELFKLAK